MPRHLNHFIFADSSRACRWCWQGRCSYKHIQKSSTNYTVYTSYRSPIKFYPSSLFCSSVFIVFLCRPSETRSSRTCCYRWGCGYSITNCQETNGALLSLFIVNSEWIWRYTLFFVCDFLFFMNGLWLIGTGRSLSLKLIQQLRQAQGAAQVNFASQAAASVVGAKAKK